MLFYQLWIKRIFTHFHKKWNIYSYLGYKLTFQLGRKFSYFFSVFFWSEYWTLSSLFKCCCCFKKINNKKKLSSKIFNFFHFHFFKTGRVHLVPKSKFILWFFWRFLKFEANSLKEQCLRMFLFPTLKH